MLCGSAVPLRTQEVYLFVGLSPRGHKMAATVPRNSAKSRRRGVSKWPLASAFSFKENFVLETSLDNQNIANAGCSPGGKAWRLTSIPDVTL